MSSQRKNEVVEFIRGLLAVDEDGSVVSFELFTEVAAAGVEDVSHILSRSLIEHEVTVRSLKATVGGNRRRPLLITVGQ